MHLSRSFALKLARSVGACLTMLAALTLVNCVASAQAAPAAGTPAARKVNPVTGTPVPRPTQWRMPPTYAIRPGRACGLARAAG